MSNTKDRYCFKAEPRREKHRSNKGYVFTDLSKLGNIPHFGEVVILDNQEPYTPLKTIEGKSLDSDQTTYTVRFSGDSFSVPNIARREDTGKAMFYRLFVQWRKETGAVSIAQQKHYHPTYLKIIGMGERAVPFLLAEVEKGSRYLFVALEAITGENPAWHASSIYQARRAWIVWGLEHGMI
jgi:hypothetical protein